MVAADQINEHVTFLWNCLKSAQENAGKTIGKLYNIKPNAVGMRLSRLGKTIEATGGGQNGNAVSDNDDSANSISQKAKQRSKARGAGAGKGKKRTVEEMNVQEDGKDEEGIELEPTGKMPKLSSSAGTKAIEEEVEEEDIAEYNNGGTADHDYKVEGF